jgi:hypothetical protein
MRRTTPQPMRRRDVRYVLPVPVTLFVAKRWIEAEAADVSHGGMFVVLEERTGGPPDASTDLLEPGQLVRVEVVLPPSLDPFGATARLVHQHAPFARDERRGVGVQFYGLGRESQERWAAFIEHVRTSYPASDERMVTLASAEVLDAAYLRSKNQVGALRVEVGAVRDLVTMGRRDVARENLFLVCRAPAFAGDELVLQIVHPLTDDVFELVGRVRRVVEDGPLRGLDFELLGCDAERKERFEEFVYDAMAPIFDDEDVLPQSE